MFATSCAMRAGRLIAGFLTYTRWRTLLAGCFSIQGRLKDIALHVWAAR